jgi:hypothetical protein
MQYYNGFYGYNDFGIFEDLYELNNEKFKITIKVISETAHTNKNKSVTSLNGLEYINGLEGFSSIRSALPNLSDISSLKSQSATLKTVIIRDSSIACCEVIGELTNLTYIDLQNNCISNYYTNDKGQKIFNVKVICETVQAAAQKAGEQGTVKLKGNDSITDWKEYTDRISSWTSDSNYGS